MKEEGIHEGCIEQIACIKKDCILVLKFQLMKRIRIDDLEMRPDVQEKVAKLWIEAVTENLSEIEKDTERIFTIYLI
jgi:enoyl-[acyl-carrier protein] reductase/trans-2-enoyl-CoA reductase (NAD+)